MKRNATLFLEPSAKIEEAIDRETREAGCRIDASGWIDKRPEFHLRSLMGIPAETRYALLLRTVSQKDGIGIELMRCVRGTCAATRQRMSAAYLGILAGSYGETEQVLITSFPPRPEIEGNLTTASTRMGYASPAKQSSILTGHLFDRAKVQTNGDNAPDRLRFATFNARLTDTLLRYVTQDTLVDSGMSHAHASDLFALHPPARQRNVTHVNDALRFLPLDEGVRITREYLRNNKPETNDRFLARVQPKHIREELGLTPFSGVSPDMPSSGLDTSFVEAVEAMKCALRSGASVGDRSCEHVLHSIRESFRVHATADNEWRYKDFARSRLIGYEVQIISKPGGSMLNIIQTRQSLATTELFWRGLGLDTFDTLESEMIYGVQSEMRRRFTALARHMGVSDAWTEPDRVKQFLSDLSESMSIKRRYRGQTISLPRVRD